MKKTILILFILLCGCRARYELVSVDDSGNEVYRTLCKKEQTTCLVNAAKACDGKYEIVEWLDRRYGANYMTPASAAVSITNTIVTKKASDTEISRGVTRKEILIFKCKKGES